MKVTSIDTNGYGSTPSGTVSISGEGTRVIITLTESEAFELHALGLRIFEARQQTIAKSIADMKPQLLAGPEVPEADFDEVPY